MERDHRKMQDASIPSWTSTILMISDTLSHSLVTAIMKKALAAATLAVATEATAFPLFTQCDEAWGLDTVSAWERGLWCPVNGASWSRL